MAKKTNKTKVDKTKASKPEPGVLQTKLVSPEQAEALNKFPYASPIKIEDEGLLIAECEKEIKYITSLRDVKRLPQKWQKARDQYAGVVEDKDFPWDDSSNLHVHITAMTVDVLNTKAQAQMYVSPMMLLRPLPGQTADKLYDSIALKEQFLDYKTQIEIGIEEKLDPVLQDAINLGTGIAKIIYERTIDYAATVSEIYESTVEDIRNFKSDFKKDKGTEAYRGYLKDLVGAGTEDEPVGISVEVWMQSDEITYDNPQISYVALDDLLVRPDIQDIDKQRVIGENMKFTWLELLNYFDQGYFQDKTIIDNLKAKYQGDNEYAKKIYDAREVICYYDYEKTNKPQRVVITYLTDEKILLRAITFPYSHRKPYYVPYYVKKVAGSFYGEGIAERLYDTNKALNTLLNQTIDSGTLRNAPAFTAVKGSNFDPSVKKWFPAAIWWVTAKDDVTALPVYGQSPEMIAMISKIEMYASLVSGVSAYAQGREAPSDPNAPASKAYMLLKESNLRLNKMIRQLHKSNVRTVEMIDKLIYQHTKRDTLPFVITKGESFETQPISRKLLGMKVQYIPQLSDIVLDKQSQTENDQNFGTYLMPLLASVPTSQRTILEILIRNQGGAWAKAIDKLLPPEAPQQAPAIPQTAGVGARGGKMLASPGAGGMTLAGPGGIPQPLLTAPPVFPGGGAA